MKIRYHTWGAACTWELRRSINGGYPSVVAYFSSHLEAIEEQHRREDLMSDIALTAWVIEGNVVNNDGYATWSTTLLLEFANGELIEETMHYRSEALEIVRALKERICDVRALPRS